jgi:hypothetical protein
LSYNNVHAGVVDLEKYMAYEEQWSSSELVTEERGHTFYSYIILEPLLCKTSPWSMTYVPWSGVLHLCTPIRVKYMLFVSARDHIVLLASLISHIFRGRRESFLFISYCVHSYFPLVYRCDLEKECTLVFLLSLDLRLSSPIPPFSLSLGVTKVS